MSLFDKIIINKFNSKSMIDKCVFINELGQQKCEICDHALGNHFKWRCTICKDTTCFPVMDYSYTNGIMRIYDVACHYCIKNSDARFSIKNSTQKVSLISCHYLQKEYKFPLRGLIDKEYENITYEELKEAVKGHSNLFFKKFIRNNLIDKSKLIYKK